MNRLSPFPMVLFLTLSTPTLLAGYGHALAQPPAYVGPQVPVPPKPAPKTPNMEAQELADFFRPSAQEDPVGFIFRFQEPLRLTPEQIYQLTRVAQETDQAACRRMTALQLYERSFAEFLASERPDLGKAEATVWTLGIARVQLHIEQLRGAASAMDILTATQQQYLRGLRISLESLVPLTPGTAGMAATCTPDHK